MFQNLRVNSTLFLLHRGANPSLECGQVVNASPIKLYIRLFPTCLIHSRSKLLICREYKRANVNLQEIPANANIADDVKRGC